MTGGAPRSDWPAIWAATLAGMAAAMQVGKAAAALPLIRAETGAELTTLAVYVSLISLVAATAGVAFGGAAQKIGPRRAGLAGLGLMAAGSAWGALAPGLTGLLASRLPEALGFALVATAMPALVGGAAAPRDRPLALGLWATWLPVGIAAAMGVALVAPGIGWRGAFAVATAAPLLAALALALFVPPDARSAVSDPPAARGLPAAVWPLMVTFAAFSAANQTVAAFLPTLLHDELGLTYAAGAGIGLLASLALVPGNLAAGWARGRGVGGRALMAAGLAGMAAFAAVLFAPVPGPWRIAAAFAYGAVCGITPAVIWGSIPLVARQPSEAPRISGAFYQGAGIGQIAGPLLTARAVAVGGWSAALWIVAGAALLGLVLVTRIPATVYAPRRTPA